MEGGFFFGTSNTFELHLVLQLSTWHVAKAWNTRLACGRATFITYDKEVAPIDTQVAPLLDSSVRANEKRCGLLLTYLVTPINSYLSRTTGIFNRHTGISNRNTDISNRFYKYRLKLYE